MSHGTTADKTIIKRPPARLIFVYLFLKNLHKSIEIYICFFIKKNSTSFFSTGLLLLIDNKQALKHTIIRLPSDAIVL